MTHCSRRRFLTLAGGALLAAPLAGRLALAAPGDWPQRPIRYVVPWPAGGPTDTFGRVIANELATLLGQPVVVENRTGATGAIGVRHVARSEPDGYTLLAPNTTSLIGNVVATPEAVDFDPLKDFTPIGLFVDSSVVLWAQASTGIANFAALRERARDAERPLSFGTTGGGSVSELSVEQLARHFGLNLLKVPYKGTAPQVADLVAGHIDIGVADYPVAAGHFASGKLVPLLVIGRQRLPELPEVPTNFELGIEEPDFTIWNGLFAPAATPAQIVARLREALAVAARSEAFRKVAEGQGNRPIFQTGEEASARLRRELDSRRKFKEQIEQGVPAA
ncbi:Bug family tripartite tricarboxylate transporter substrate binding protein [Azotobacter vinelandii]|uniref:Bug family tripartite tricarboxylate transporter substrate binding protein n=1 Tax=Azotobacter vinelandii TaxID=354 RepID=UPI002665E5AF|nr:tripartite tricarboxylate transporter substrate binding protein [Azotobacter vinelandii]WKN22390.1 tripartite tricarboxylate transporter substrate binding protein [Azotobacter vinelandii]